MRFNPLDVIAELLAFLVEVTMYVLILLLFVGIGILYLSLVQSSYPT